MGKISKSMKLGSHKIKIILYYLLFFLYFSFAIGQEKIKLESLQPTIEEEPESIEMDNNQEISKIKSKNEKKLKTGKIIVKLRALDKITAKTSDINVNLGEKKRFGYLEILPKICKKSKEENNSGVAAYLQIKDLSVKQDEKVFVFNGWTFSSSPTLRPFEHPVYDIWVTDCENV